MFFFLFALSSPSSLSLFPDDALGSFKLGFVCLFILCMLYGFLCVPLSCIVYRQAHVTRPPLRYINEKKNKNKTIPPPSHFPHMYINSVVCTTPRAFG